MYPCTYLKCSLELFLPGSVEFLCDEDKNLVGIVFQDGIMKSTFSALPEVLLVDATYKLTELRMPVYLMMVVDGMVKVKLCVPLLQFWKLKSQWAK